MAVEISNGTTVPHATNYADLLAKLKTFATANGWVSVASPTGEEYLRGTGGGADNIYIGIKTYADVGTDNYGWILMGMTGYSSGAGFFNQPGGIPTDPPALPLWNTTIPYWFVVSSRRIIVVAKVSTVYMVAYMGWILPYAVPSQWPYPMVIGGSALAVSPGHVPTRYSDTTDSTTICCIPIQSGARSTLALRDASGTWLRLMNQIGTEAAAYELFDGSGVWPWNVRLDDNYFGFDEMEKTLDGRFMLQPAVMHQESPARNCYGEFDGIYHVSGRNNGAENLIQRAGIDHLVVQNVFRTAKQHYCAVKLS